MTEEEQLLDRIRTHIYLNDCHLEEWFEDFDKLRSGRVSPEQFRRCFEFVKFPLRDEEFSSLAKLFADGDDINWRKFCNTIVNVFTNPELEKKPLESVTNSRAIVDRVTNRITDSIPPDVEALFSKLAYQVITNGVHVREAYMDFDQHNVGRVTKNQFLRNLPFKNLSTEEIDLLVKRYLDAIVGDINYKRLHLDINDYIGYKHVGDVLPDFDLPHHKQSIKSRPMFSDPNTVIDRFATYCYKNRVRIKDFFLSHDNLNSGRVTTEVFQNVLTLFGFQFSAEELAYLAELYKVVMNFTDFVSYRDFVNDVLSREKQISGTFEPPKITDIRARNIIEKIRTFIGQQRINILPPFQDFDKTRHGYVTESQFHRVLSLVSIPVSTEDVNILYAVYGNNNSEVDYLSFIEDVDPQYDQHRRESRPDCNDRESIEKRYGQTPSGDAFVTTEKADQLIYESKKGLLPKVQERKDIELLLDDMQKWSYIHSVYFQDFMKDFDKHNSGEITHGQMRSAILMSGYRLTDDEFDMIARSYQSPKNADKLQWKRFTEDIMKFVAPKDLEVTPLVKPQNPRLIVSRSLRDPVNDTNIPDSVRRILENINRYCRVHRISLMEEFVDKDKHNHKQISFNGFAQVMQLIGVHITMNEIQTLCSFYIDPATNFVMYPKFVSDVESLGGLKHEEYTTLTVNPIPEYSKDVSGIIPHRPNLTADELTWNHLLPRIQAFIYKRRIGLKLFFENFDRLRHGVVTQQKWRTVVGETDLPIGEDEIQFIGKLFALEKKPDLFNYRYFVEQVNEIFGPLELHRSPRANPNCRAALIPDPSLRVQPITDDEQILINQVLNRMRNYIMTRRMEIRQQFEDYDRLPKRKYITKSQFKQCIGRLSVPTTEKELELLCKRYKCTDLDEVNYIAFVADVGGYDEPENPFNL